MLVPAGIIPAGNSPNWRTEVHDGKRYGGITAELPGIYAAIRVVSIQSSKSSTELHLQMRKLFQKHPERKRGRTTQENTQRALRR